MASFGSALTFVLLSNGTACTSHLNNPVFVGAGTLVGVSNELVIPVRMSRDGRVLDVWETFSDTDWYSTQWVQSDGSDIPVPAEGTFGWAFNAMIATPGVKFAPVGYREGMYYFFDGVRILLRLPSGLDVRPAFPAREMRGSWRIL